MKRKEGRKGFSLVELLIAIVVLAILGTITFVAGTSAQKRARLTSASTVFDNYKSAFNTAMMDHPGLRSARKDTWGADGTTYTYKAAFSRLVALMNRTLSPEEQFEWNDEDKLYESRGEDPWGGHYVLLEYPEMPGDSFYDFTTIANQASMRISIWCSGPDSDIVIPVDNVVTVRDISIGIAIRDESGDITSKLHGGEDGSVPFVGATIQTK